MRSIKKPIGAQPLLNDEEKIEVKKYINNCYKNKNNPTIQTVLQYVYCAFDKLLDSDSLVKFLRRFNIAQSVLAKPLDNERAIISMFNAI